MIWTIGGHDQNTAIYRTIFFSFFSCILPNKDYVSGDLKTWTVDMADAVGEGCLGRSVPSPGAGLVMSPLKVWFKAPVVNRSHSAEVSGCCVRPLEPNEPSALTNLPLLKLEVHFIPSEHYFSSSELWFPQGIREGSDGNWSGLKTWKRWLNIYRKDTLQNECRLLYGIIVFSKLYC